MKKTRFTYFDSLRGIAAVIVVLVHYFAAFYPYSVFGDGDGPQHHSWEKLFFIPPFGLLLNGHFSVCLFFILSGFVLSYGYFGQSGNRVKLLVAVIKRPVRLGGLVLFGILLSAILWQSGLYFNDQVFHLGVSGPWFRDYWQGNLDVKKLLSSLTTSIFRNGYIYNPPLWTIRMELYGSIMVFAFLLLFKNVKYRLVLLTLLVVLFHNSLYQGFWLGLIIADLMKRGIIQNWSAYQSTKVGRLVMITAVILLAYLSSYPHYAEIQFVRDTIYGYLPDDKGFGGGYPMFTALITFLIVCVNHHVQTWLNQPPLLFLGQISYGVYVVHFLILGSFSSWMFLSFHQSWSHELSFSATLIFGLLAIMALGYLSTKYIDALSIKLASYIGRKALVSLNSLQARIAPAPAAVPGERLPEKIGPLK
ncbi:acyltransferase [filamentous cyanobacterium LEGE 11480]|uniref:Acyltransferase n=1 Tax=Romeriopsis navalis LEGE 11480 TaxID=2777977 RepID=A0A928VUF8_9CYAN|nr:acyltransferase [Romeriopsis navalis]MBE9032444.1 acyltransferase [Romeriopsis navalis LEGE 11480]